MEDRGGLRAYVCMYLGGTSLQFLPCQTLAQACAPCPPSLSLQDCTVSKSVPLDSGTGSVPPVSGVVLAHLVNLCVLSFLTYKGDNTVRVNPCYSYIHLYAMLIFQSAYKTAFGTFKSAKSWVSIMTRTRDASHPTGSYVWQHL